MASLARAGIGEYQPASNRGFGGELRPWCLGFSSLGGVTSQVTSHGASQELYILLDLFSTFLCP